LALAALLVIVLSSLMVERLSTPILRLLEGYWPPLVDRLRVWLTTRRDPKNARKVNWLRRWLTTRRNKKIARNEDKIIQDEERLRQLLALDESGLTRKELADLSRLDSQRHNRPAEPSRRMPTRLGNILRASETRPRDYYGLDANVCWPHLWLLLPDAAKQEVSAARANLNAAAQLWFWGVIFIGWAVWAWWALPVGIAVAIASYSRMLGAATIYAELVEGCFHLHRRLLYEALHWPPPVRPADEKQRGQAVTKYLWRGSSETTPVFTRSLDQNSSTAG
jgi:hypothetical protein